MALQQLVRGVALLPVATYAFSHPAFLLPAGGGRGLGVKSDGNGCPTSRSDPDPDTRHTRTRCVAGRGFAFENGLPAALTRAEEGALNQSPRS